MSEADDYIKRLEERLSPETINAVINSDKIFYNEGVDACIEVVKRQALISHHDKSFFKKFGHLNHPYNSLIQQLEQLKKP